MEKISKKEKFIIKAKNKFSDMFDYDNIEYVNSSTNIKIKCNEHNEYFNQIPSEHLRGRKGCNLCTRNPKVDTDFFIKKAKLAHGERYNYSLITYVNSETKVKIICSEHGVFEQLPNQHYKQNCPKCHSLIKNKDKILTNDKFIRKGNNVHNNKYDYSLVNYINSKTKVKIICPNHGEFEQLPYSHLRGKSCFKCSIDSIKIKLSSSIKEFIDKSSRVHNNKYDYSNSIYVNAKTKLNIICPEHGEFEQKAEYHINGSGCLKCALTYNKLEKELKDFIISLGINFIENTRKTIPPLELDIYIPSANIAIEFNGLYWHSELYKPNNYHLNKTELCEKQGIKLIHIFEDEWLYKKEIVKSRLMNILGLTPNKIYARKCIIKDVSSKDSKIFLENNHLQGSVNSKIKIGLYYNDELVSLMTFGGLRKSMGGISESDTYELLRFCNKLDTIIIGGADKLFKYFFKTYQPKQIISYADRRWSQGDLYKKLSFKFIHNSQPNYYYIINGKREYRFKYRKDVLVKQGFDKNKSEREIMQERGIYRIYDCGSKRYELNLVI